MRLKYSRYLALSPIEPVYINNSHKIREKKITWQIKRKDEIIKISTLFLTYFFHTAIVFSIKKKKLYKKIK